MNRRDAVVIAPGDYHGGMTSFAPSAPALSCGTSDLIGVAEATALIAQNLPDYGTQTIALDDAAGRVLRQCVLAERDQPPFHRVMMDGIAIRWSQALPERFPVSGVQFAGTPLATLASEAACVEVATGAVLPDGCDCVIPIERTQREGDGYRLIANYAPKPGQFIHPQGQDCRAGDAVLEAGVRIGAAEMALLAANGVAQVCVARVPSIAIVVTGDELVRVDAPLNTGQIRSVNEYALKAAFGLHGFSRIVVHHIRDDAQATRDTLARVLRD